MTTWFYRTAAGAEIDLVLDFGHQKGLWVIEIKRSLAPKMEKGFRQGLADLHPRKAFIVYLGDDTYPISEDTAVTPLRGLLTALEEA